MRLCERMSSQKSGSTGIKDWQLGFLSLMFWGASLMWGVDVVYEYAEAGAKYFLASPYGMLNDFFRVSQ